MKVLAMIVPYFRAILLCLPLLEIGLDNLKNLLTELILLRQMPEGQNRCLIGDPMTDQIDSNKIAYGRNLDQLIFYSRITEAVPLLHQVNPQHGSQGIRLTATLTACF